MKYFIIIFCMMTGFSATCQTKLIAFKSHSGNMKDFYKLVALRDVDLVPHNLGMAPQRIVRTAQLDTVIYVNDTTTIMVTSNYCHEQGDPSMSAWIWSAGTDTIVNDEFWNQDDPNKIRKDLKKEFHFRNSMDSVVFVGFPEREVEKDIDKNREAGGGYENEESFVPVSNDRTTPGMGIPIAVTAVFLMGIFLALMSWRRAHFKGSRFS